jgi:hypothetical protein
MIDFIIKSTLFRCPYLAAVYHILLEKRKYISSIDFTFCFVFSLSIPFITISDSGIYKSFDRKAAIKPGEPTMTIIED